MGCCVEIIGIIVALVIGIVTLCKWKYSYWKRRNLPFLQPTIPFGSMENPFKRTSSIGVWVKKNYDELKSQGHKHGGLYNFLAPVYMPLDIDYVKNIMQKDFQYFTERGTYYNEKDDPLTAHLFNLGGKKWRNLRTRLTPVFTSGKMKMMFDTLVACSHPMKELVDKLTEANKPIDIKEIVGRFSTDIIGSCAFGLDCNSFKDPNSEFRKQGKAFFNRTPFELASALIFISNPSLGHFFKIRLLSKNVTDFFFNVVNATVEYREKNNVTRNDMLQLLINMKSKTGDNGEEKHDGTTLTIEEIAAQALVFFAAGFETSSTTMTFCLFELATNPDIQEKVRDEIKVVLAKHNNEITYEAMHDLHYMTQVIDETLRKYPPVPHLTRKSVQDYKVPDSDIVIEKGTNIFISVLGLHYDPDYFPNPEKFDPERFSPENKQQIQQFSYLPFGEGPRVCIGLRFGMMQTKVGLTVLLKNYIFTVNSKTELPLKIDPKGLVYSTKDVILLNTTKI